MQKREDEIPEIKKKNFVTIENELMSSSFVLLKGGLTFACGHLWPSKKPDLSQSWEWELPISYMYYSYTLQLQLMDMICWSLATRYCGVHL